MNRIYNYQYIPRQQIPLRKPPGKRSFGRFVVTLLALVLLVGGGAFVWSNFDKVVSFSGAKKLLPKHDSPINQQELSARLAPYMPKDWTLGIYLFDINSSSSYGYNADQSFTAASLTKLPALITAFQAVQDGKLKMSDQIPFLASELEDYGTSILQYKGPGTTYSAQDLLWYMANRSDNSAFQIFLDKFGDTSIDSSIQKWGFAKTSIIQDTTTPRDMVGMFYSIYSKALVSDPALNKQMQDLLTKTNEESRIPAGVPSGVRVVHKTGNAIGGLQDAGIVYLSGRPYILALMSSGVSDEAGAANTEEQVSKVIYDYLSQLN